MEEEERGRKEDKEASGCKERSSVAVMKTFWPVGPMTMAPRGSSMSSATLLSHRLVTNTRSAILSSLAWTAAGLSTELHSTDRQTSFDSTVRSSATPWNALRPALSTSTSNWKSLANTAFGERV